MPNSGYRGSHAVDRGAVFSDPDDYAATIRGCTAELTVTGRGQFKAKLARIDLHNLWMQRFSDYLPRIFDISGIAAGRAYITFRTNLGPSLVVDGVEIPPTAILRHGRAREYYQRSSGPADFGTMSLPLEEMAAVGEAMAAADLAPPRDPILVNPSPEAVATLQRLHAAAAHLAEHAPEIIANPNAAHGLEQALIAAMAECLYPASEHENTLAQGQHAIVMRRFRRLLEENPDQPLYIPDLAKAIRISARALRLCCQEHLGMSPKCYLMLRRMNLVRRTLRAAAPGAGSVTDIAMRYGFWPLGRFAVEYRRLFGELPSVTLKRQPE